MTFVAELEAEVASLPEGWHEVVLSDVAKVNPETLRASTPADFNFGYIDISQIDGPGRCAGWTQQNFGNAPSRARRKVRAGDILVSTVRPYLRSFAQVPDADLPLVASTGFAVIRAGKEADQQFLYQHILHSSFIDHLTPRMTGSNYPAVSASDIEAYRFLLPPLDEQRRIAEVLRSVDEAITTAQQVAEQCEQVLQLELDNIVAKLLSDDIPQVKLGDIAKVKGGKRLPKGSAYSDEPTGNPYIRVTDWRDYEIRTDDIRFISDNIARSIWRYTISKSDLFISIAGSVGLVASIPDELDGAYLTENAAKICINDPEKLNATYLLAVLRSRTLAEQIDKHKGVGGGVPKLALFRIENLDIPLPDLAAQEEIACSYQSLRASVEAARNAANQIELAKGNVMSDLLSGRVRVPA